MPRKIYSESSKLIKKRIFGDFGIFVFESLDIAKSAAPGQFIMLKVKDERSLLLARPFSIFYAEDGRIELLIKRIGRVTSELFLMHTEESVNLLGPLGNGFDNRNDSVVLIGGGSGIAPLYFYARKYGFLRFIVGFSTYMGSLFKTFPEGTEIVTEDGSFEKKGFPTDYLESDGGVVYSCGPVPMLKALEKKRLKNLENTYVSLESMMGCGFGICAGCGIGKRKERGYFRVCSDGPVFPLSLIKI